MALRAVFDRTLREAPKSFSSVASVPTSLLLCVEKLACLGSAARLRLRRVSTGRRKDVRASQGAALGAVLEEVPANQHVVAILAEIRRAPL
jgi:hypothetical protein